MTRIRQGLVIGVLIAVFAGCAQTPGSVTVAFFGDQGLSDNARAVLRMVVEENADLVLHQGDLDYADDPVAWDAMVTEELGADFPYFASIGNHDSRAWDGPDGYQAKLQARLDRVEGASCIGELGIKAACTYDGLFIILSAAGWVPREPDNPEHIAFIQEQLAASDATWEICSWHMNQTEMQVGRKRDAVGWGPYRACREAGAIIVTGHEHSYSRTHLMDSFEKLSVASTSDTLVIEEGQSFVVVTGTGGQEVRPQFREGDWWASIYTSDQEALPGALFCTFRAGGEPDRAGCYFKNIAGEIIDQFELQKGSPQT
jgi:hypothetical protein